MSEIYAVIQIPEDFLDDDPHENDLAQRVQNAIGHTGAQVISAGRAYEWRINGSACVEED